MCVCVCVYAINLCINSKQTRHIRPTIHDTCKRLSCLETNYHAYSNRIGSATKGHDQCVIGRALVQKLSAWPQSLLIFIPYDLVPSTRVARLDG